MDPGGWTRPKDMRDYCGSDNSSHRCSADSLGHWLAFDVMGEFLVGQKYGTLKDPTNRFMIDTIRDMNKRIGVYSQSPSLIYLGLDLIWSPITRDCRRHCMKWMKAMRTNLISQYYDGSAILDSTAVNPSHSTEKLGMPIEDISSEAQFLVAAGDHPNQIILHFAQVFLADLVDITAGTETSATLFAALFFYLTHYPTAYRKLADEIRERFSGVEQIHSGPALATCIYLFACINEALRMSPPAVGSHWREVESEGQYVDGSFIPGGYDVGTCIYAIHHNEEYFPNSFEFLPERWLPGYDMTEEKLTAAKKAFNPFSLGPRACIGRSLAMTEISVALARVIYSMDFRQSDGQIGEVGEGRPGEGNGRHRVREYQLASHLTSWSSGPMIQFRRRDM